jgi:hypothetical protein
MRQWQASSYKAIKGRISVWRIIEAEKNENRRGTTQAGVTVAIVSRDIASPGEPVPLRPIAFAR